MESILQSIVKIIIIGSLYDTNVNCNRQFLPPLSYYQKEDHFQPGFAPPFREIFPVWYSKENAPPSISFQNVNDYTPPQLFHRNVNYNPSQFTSPGVKYSALPILPYKPNFYQPYQPAQKINYEVSEVDFKKPSDKPGVSPEQSAETPSKKSAFFATNIIIKEESHSPYYQDDYNKHYYDDDYSDSYSDDSSPQPEPCTLNSLYRYFEPPKADTNNPRAHSKYTLCNPYFQPNFGNSVLSAKMPITLLPSRFPPRVEQLLERIQNYFSTYTHQETPKPQNQTSSTTQPPVEASSEGVTQPTVIMEDLNKKNITGENQKPNSEPANPEESNVTTSGELDNLGQVTQKTIVVEIEANEEEVLSTASPDVQIKKESLMIIQSTQSPHEGIQAVFMTTNQQESQPNEQYLKADSNNSLSENQSLKEQNYLTVTDPMTNKEENPKVEIQLVEEKGWSSITESAEERNRTEASTVAQSINVSKLHNVTDNNG